MIIKSIGRRRKEIMKTLIKTLSNDLHDKIVKHLKEVLDDNAYGTYYAGTLGVHVDGLDIYLNLDTGTIELCSAKSFDVPHDIRVLLAQLYVKHKTPNSTFYNDAVEILEAEIAR